MADGVHQLRQYSLSSDPGGELRRITVKRVAGTADTPDGEVSNMLHHHVRAGDELTLSAPFGDIFLDDPADATTPVVLVSAGIGGTPMTGILAHLTALGSTRPVLVLHADRSPADHALRTETSRLVTQLPGARAIFWYEHPGPEAPDAREGLMNLDGIELPGNATVFLCGPLPFMRDIRAQLLSAGVPPRSIRYEVFGPDLWLPGPAA
ncbi:Flavohemoprotein (plasmid) [Streptomyces sp. enrichment culture]